MSKKERYQHQFVNGQIVTDHMHKETFVFHAARDGWRADQGHLRPATDEEKKRFSEFIDPKRP